MRNRKANELPASLKTIDVKSVLRRSGVYRTLLVNREMKEAALPLARQIIQAKHKSLPGIELAEHAQLSNPEIEAYIEKQLHIIHVIEDKFEVKLQQFISKMVDDFLAHLESEIATNKKLDSFNTKDYFDDEEDTYKAQAQLDFTPLLESVATLAGAEALKLINSRDIYINTLRKQIADNVAKFTQSMLDTDKQHLTDIITDGIKNGQSLPQIRASIQTDFDNISKSQATRITKTEVSRASIQSAKNAWAQSGVVEAYQWIVVSPVDECADFANEVRAADGSDGTFYDIANDYQDGDPPLHPNCNCSLVPVLVGN